MDGDEQALIARYVAGDQGAYETLYGLHSGRVRRTVSRFLYSNHEDSIDDVCQEVWIKVAKNLEGFRSESRFSTWVTRIAANESLQYLRHKRAFPEESLDEPISEEYDVRPEPADSAPSPADRLINKELGTLLATTMNLRLGENPRIALICRAYGLTAEEFTELTGRTEGSYKAGIHHAKIAMQRGLRASPRFAAAYPEYAGR